jgi:mono/diheme cytochrome c family protein
MNPYKTQLTAQDLANIAEALAVGGCSTASGTGTDTGTGTGLDGASLYVSSCSCCHGGGKDTTDCTRIAGSVKQGATFARIRWAIDNQVEMQGVLHGPRLRALTDDQIRAIAQALGTGGGVSSGSCGDTGSGTGSSSLYMTNCSCCHGGVRDANDSTRIFGSVKQGATFTRIRWAIENEVEMRSPNLFPNLTALTDEQVHAIARELGGEI